MRQKIVMICVPLLLGALVWFQVIPLDRVIGYARHIFYRGKGAVHQAGAAPPAKDANAAALCRQNLVRIQNAKRKAGFDRGNTVGVVSWTEVLTAMYPDEARRGRLTPSRINYLMPVCPNSGTYTLGSMHEMVRCSIMGNDSVDAGDDHIAHN